MSQVPDIHYSPGIRACSFCGCQRVPCIPAIRSRLGSPAGKVNPHHNRIQEALGILANRLAINKLPWSLGTLSHPSIGRAGDALIVLPSSPEGLLNS
jgi:hypothetical protein